MEGLELQLPGPGLHGRGVSGAFHGAISRLLAVDEEGQRYSEYLGILGKCGLDLIPSTKDLERYMDEWMDGREREINLIAYVYIYIYPCVCACIPHVGAKS